MSNIDYDFVEIIDGRSSGGALWILPHCIDDNTGKEIDLPDKCGISIMESLASEFLIEFLYYFYDPDIQTHEKLHQFEEYHFDWFEPNEYSAKDIRIMLKLISKISDMFINDYNNPILDCVKENFAWFLYTNKRRSELSEEEFEELLKKRVSVAVNFYDRFVKRMEVMLELPGINKVSFCGP